MEELRAEVLELIDIALVELKAVAQPHEKASLNELRIDASDAPDEATLRSIARQVQSLREFCEKRTSSSANFRMDQPPSGRRRLK